MSGGTCYGGDTRHYDTVMCSILSILVKNLKGLRTDSLKSLIERSICALFRYLAIQNFHPIYSYVAIGNMSTANTNSTQFKLRYIQAHIISTILSESNFLQV